MKKLILPVILMSFLVSCGGSTETGSVTSEYEGPPAPPAPAAPPEPFNVIQTREYKGAWAGTKYSVTFDVTFYKEGKPSDNYHDFTINNGGTVPGFISVTTVKMDSAGQKPHEIINNQHRNLKGVLLGEAQTEVAAEKFGENDVYLFRDKSLSGFGQDAIIICNGEAIHVKFQTQGPEEAAIEKDKAAFRTLLAAMQVSK